MSQRHLKRVKKFVVLEGIVAANCGHRFWTLAMPDGSDNTWGINQETHERETWYREIAFTDSDQEALEISQTGSYRRFIRDDPESPLLRD